MRHHSRSSKELGPFGRFFFSRIFPLIFVLVGGAVLYFGARSLMRAKASVDWPTAEGTIVRSSVEYRRGDKGGGTYHAEVYYEFLLDGQTRSGTDVAFGDFGSSNSGHARAIVNRYPAGKAVTVRYLPGKPDVCVLEPGMKGQAWAMPGFGLVFFLAGAGMMVFLPRAMRKQAGEAPPPPPPQDEYDRGDRPAGPAPAKSIFDEVPVKKD